MRDLEANGLLVKVADACGHRATQYRMDVTAVPAKPLFTRADSLSSRQGECPANGTGPREDEMAGRGRTSPTSRADIAVSAEPSLEPSGEPSQPLPTSTARSSGVVVEGEKGNLGRVGFAPVASTPFLRLR
jgi:hypothetical protein